MRVIEAKHLEPLKGGKVPVEILVRNPKDAEQNAKHFEKCLDVIKGAGVCDMRMYGNTTCLTYQQNKVGTITKDTSTGPFAEEWRKVFGDILKDVEEVDIAMAISSAALAIKDENELVRCLPWFHRKLASKRS